MGGTWLVAEKAILAADKRGFARQRDLVLNRRSSVFIGGQKGGA
jgi:hypothetical protein